MNTEYKLFGPNGPEVSTVATHRGRLDEMCKCLGVAPGNATLRLFWADATISVEGPDLGEWQYWVGKRAPSEQQMANFLMPNIEAAWRGETRTRTVEEAKKLWYEHGSTWDPAPACPEAGGHPTPGVFVRRSARLEGEDWCEGDEAAWPLHGWRTRPTRESAARFLAGVRSNRCNPVDLLSTPSEAVMGVLLDVDGADIRFLSQSPLSRSLGNSRSSDPSACVTVLGGPKGISDAFKAVVRGVFEEARVPLAEVCLGPREEMAHACVAFLRIQEDAGLFRAAVVDLLRTGQEGYRAFSERLEAAARRAIEGEAGADVPAADAAAAEAPATDTSAAEAPVTVDVYTDH